MAYTTVVTGTTISSSWANADVRDQVVVPFASTAARSAAITAPVAGMVSTLTTNLSTEGVYQYNSAGQWRQAWNQPWGIVSYMSTTSASSTTSSTTELAITTFTAFTAVANRYYRLCWNGTALGTVAADLFNLQIKLTSTAGTSYANQKLTVQAGSFQCQFALDFVTSSIAAGSTTLVGTAQRQAGTGTLQTLASALNQAVVYDCGPSGAPS